MLEDTSSNVQTVVSYIHSGVYGASHSYSMRVFDFRIDTVKSWNKMMRELGELHPEAKNGIIIIFIKELQN